MEPSATGGAGIIAFVLIIGLGLSAVWLWSLIHCIMNKRLSDTNRIIGIVLIVVLGLLGSIIYPFLPREAPARSSQARSRRR